MDLQNEAIEIQKIFHQDYKTYWEETEAIKAHLEARFKALGLYDVMHSVFTIHSTENDDIIKVVGTKEKAIQEVKEFKDDHAYADFYWQEQALK